jgi:hypothetical protein
MAKRDAESSSAGKNKDKTMRMESHSGPGGGGTPPIDRGIQTEIGKQLRAIYDDVVNEPVPSKFMELLEQLERSSTRKG